MTSEVETVTIGELDPIGDLQPTDKFEVERVNSGRTTLADILSYLQQNIGISGADYFLSAKPSGVGSYGVFTTAVNGLPETDYTATLSDPDTEYLVAAFITNGNFNEQHVPPGLWSFHTNVSVSGSGGVTHLVYRVYKRSADTTETQIFSVESAEIDNTSLELIETDYVLTTPAELLLTDEIVVKVYAKTTSSADRVVTLAVDGTGHASHVVTTLGKSFDPGADRTITGEWTFVVPAGQSFRIVDDAVTPTISVLVNNRDAAVFAGPDAIGYALVCGQTGSETEPIAMIYGYTVPDSESEGYRATSVVINATDGLGKSARLSVGVEPGGKSIISANAEVVNLNLQTHADNASALAAGLPVGANYKRPDGANYTVV